MNEEEIIKTLNYQLKMKDTDVYTPINYDAIQGLLDLYTKQQKEIKRLKEFEKYYENEKVIWQRKDYISKDKIKELKEFYIKDYLNRNITLIPLNNLVKNINILLGE